MSNYEKFAAINVNSHIEKKNNLSYLSWAWAVDQLLRIDPEATWEYGEPKLWGETAMVFCTVTAFGKAMTAQLPVMDHRNKAIANPDAFQVNTAMQRCLAKAIALHGLGLYIYAGEDLPEEEKKKKGTITPTSGLWEALSIDEQKFLSEIAATVTEFLSNEHVTEACMHINDCKLDTEEKAALWTRFDSKQRSAMKKEFERLKGIANES